MAIQGQHKAARRLSGTTTAAAALPLSEVGIDQVIMAAALSLFQERGFYGTSMRDIAARSGTSVSHLYYYFNSKAQVLKSLMIGIVRDLIAELDNALAAAGAQPADRLAALVRAEVLFHCQRQAEAFVGRSELRSLEADDKSEVIALYDQVTAMFACAIAAGVRNGAFDCPHRAEATRAIITMCNGVSGWYRVGGGLTPRVVADRYVCLVLAMVCAARPLDGVI